MGRARFFLYPGFGLKSQGTGSGQLTFSHRAAELPPGEQGSLEAFGLFFGLESQGATALGEGARRLLQEKSRVGRETAKAEATKVDYKSSEAASFVRI